jgi:hypothetical protein
METLVTPFQDHLDHDRHAVLRHHLLRLVEGGEDLARLEHADGLAAESLDDPDVVDAVSVHFGAVDVGKGSCTK